jgi:hypothetical protein
MLQSARRVHPECDLYFLLVDRHYDGISEHTEFKTIDLDELHIPGQNKMAFAYDIVEMNTAVKPFLLSHLLEKGYSKVIYIDPDIFVYNRLDQAIEALDTHSIVLTPHALNPAPPANSFAGKVQWEQNMLVGGIFNLGFIALSNRKNTKEFLTWWQNRCTYLCYIEPIVGLFVDQKWAELAIAYWNDVFILRDPGYNVSVWNLHERSISNLHINENSKLIFYHYSSIDMTTDTYISKHVKSINFQRHPALIELFANYKSTIRKNEFDYYHSLPYVYGCFKDGKMIDVLERRLYAQAADGTWNPFLCTKTEFYRRLKKHTRSIIKKRNGLLLSLASILCYSLLRIIGANNYRNIMMLGTKAIQLRAHSFLFQW